jgi:oligoribonuclease (3'-5' exoribonuclease)
MSRLLFLDCETTGLTPEDAKLLEVGMVVVELPTFDIVAETSHVFHFELKPTLTRDHYFKWQVDEIFIHRKVVDMHKANGLWESCKRSQLVDYQKMDELCQRFIVDNGCQGSVLAGANPDFDRRFLRKVLPGTEKLLHYRNFDTNTFWLLQSFITGEDARREKPASHRAVDDCKDAVGVVEKHFEFFQKLVGGG